MTAHAGSGAWAARVAPVERTAAEARTTYDRLAPWYDYVEAPFERRARAAGLRLLDVRPGERILEIGFGTGHTLSALAPQVGARGSVIGVDLSMGMVRVARRRLTRLGPHIPVSLTQSDARHLPLGDATVDAVTMSFTLELMVTEDISVVLQECGRVLRAGGRLSVVSLALPDTPNRMTRAYLALHRRWPRLADCRPLPLQDVLADNGFAPITIWSSSIAGLPVIAVAARKDVAADQNSIGGLTRSGPENREAGP